MPEQLAELRVISILLAAIGSGLIGGVFFAFSTSVMKALASIPASAGIAAMQTINKVILNPLFLLTFLGTAVTSAGVIVLSLFDWNARGSLLGLLGGALYLLGSFGITMWFNVPRNTTLAKTPPSAATSEVVWRRYLAEWTSWNHVRTAASFVAAVLLSLALRY